MMDDFNYPQSSLILSKRRTSGHVFNGLEAETLWLTQAQMADLFQVTPQTCRCI